MTRFFSFAVPSPPEIIAPAWPILFPGGAVAPPMKPATGLSIFSLIQRAASSSAVPPISPIIITANDRRNRSEEHTSELQSRGHLVCRLLLEKKKNQILSSTLQTD